MPFDYTLVSWPATQAKLMSITITLLRIRAAIELLQSFQLIVKLALVLWNVLASNRATRLRGIGSGAIYAIIVALSSYNIPFGDSRNNVTMANLSVYNLDRRRCCVRQFETKLFVGTRSYYSHCQYREHCESLGHVVSASSRNTRSKYRRELKPEWCFVHSCCITSQLAYTTQGQLRS